jgi:hypothetical protein
MPEGSYALVETSVEYGPSKVPSVPGAVKGTVLTLQYFIKQIGPGRSTIMHLSRVDFR